MVITKQYSLSELEDLARQVRRDIVRMVHGCQSGHPGGSLGCTDYLVALYFKIMRHNPQFTMDGVGEDLFFLSNGHISPVFYSVLARSGYFPVEELATFRKINSRVQGHPTTHEGLPGVRIASGSLGQGLSVAIGAALTKKRKQENTLVFSLHGDGELQEGQMWEAALFAPAKKVDNLIMTIDVNGQQIDGSTEQVLSLGNLEAKLEAFGWDVLKMNGNNMPDVIDTLERAKSRAFNGKPICILMQTNMGHGVSFMMGSHKWHGVAPNDEQLDVALSELATTLQDF
ncbi:MAG TPA: transketolase [Flavisolibacter sp.]